MIQLTVDEIKALPAGRELDAMIWHQVMHPNAAKGVEARCAELGWTAPKYSTHIAAAWDVLEKVQEIGCLQNSGGFGWRCEICATYPGGPECAGEADTAPLAICRAALLWARQR